MTIELKLSIEDANLILKALGERPFREVFTLVEKIQEQAAAQLEKVGEEDSEVMADNGERPE